MPTFAELEGGRYSRPIDLYRFDYGTEIFRFTNNAEDYVFGGTTYTALEISRSAPSQNPRERRNTKLQVKALASQRPFSDYIGIQPAVTLNCTITRIQLDEVATASPFSSPQPPPAPATGFVLFEGYVTSIAFKGRTCDIDMNPFNEQFSREIPRYKYQSLCNHVLYDSFCTIDKNSFKQSGLVNGEDGNDISVNGFSGSAFTGGYVQNEAGNDYRMIIEQVGDTFTLLLPFRSILGETVTAFQGCDHSVQTCKTKFNNVANFGGFPLVPGTNPFNQAQFTKS
jgi:hypothetical protein